MECKIIISIKKTRKIKLEIERLKINVLSMNEIK